MRILEFLAAYFRSGGGRVVERPAGGRVTPTDHGDDVPAVVSRGGPIAPEVVPLDSLLEEQRGRDELDEHYADARAVVDAGRAAVDRYDADRAGAPTDVRGVPLPPPIAPAPAGEYPDRSS